MDDCIFCKIVRQEIPSTVVYEDDVVKAFLDITQTTPGHTWSFQSNMLPIFSNMTPT